MYQNKNQYIKCLLHHNNFAEKKKVSYQADQSAPKKKNKTNQGPVSRKCVRHKFVVRCSKVRPIALRLQTSYDKIAL